MRKGLLLSQGVLHTLKFCNHSMHLIGLHYSSTNSIAMQINSIAFWSSNLWLNCNESRSHLHSSFPTWGLICAPAGEIPPPAMPWPVFLFNNELKKLAKTPSDVLAPPGPTPFGGSWTRNIKCCKSFTVCESTILLDRIRRQAQDYPETDSDRPQNFKHVVVLWY